jgi:tRNA threonylcarbamoyladenosine biosynthesis protein TsaB
MPSLSQLLTDHRSLLVFDAASTRVQVGLIQSEAPALWRATTDEAGRGIFTCSREILTEAGLKLEEIGAFVFCEGPGSMLGVRTVAMALRTWQALKPRPAFAYQSLAVAAQFEWTKNGKREFAVIADARREMWHRQQIAADGRLSPLQRLPAAELPAGELLTPENFRAWSKPPHPAGECSYDLAKLFSGLHDENLFRATEAPDAFQHEAPEYKKWPALIHSIETVDKDPRSKLRGI